MTDRYLGHDLSTVPLTDEERALGVLILPDGGTVPIPDPPCLCGSEGPDSFGNYDQIVNPDCPRCS